MASKFKITISFDKAEVDWDISHRIYNNDRLKNH